MPLSDFIHGVKRKLDPASNGGRGKQRVLSIGVTLSPSALTLPFRNSDPPGSLERHSRSPASGLYDATVSSPLSFADTQRQTLDESRSSSVHHVFLDQVGTGTPAQQTALNGYFFHQVNNTKLETPSPEFKPSYGHTSHPSPYSAQYDVLRESIEQANLHAQSSDTMVYPVSNYSSAHVTDEATEQMNQVMDQQLLPTAYHSDQDLARDFHAHQLALDEQYRTMDADLTRDAEQYQHATDARQQIKSDAITPDFENDGEAQIDHEWFDHRNGMASSAMVEVQYTDHPPGYHTRSSDDGQAGPSHAPVDNHDYRPSACLLEPCITLQAAVRVPRPVYSTLDDFNRHLQEAHSEWREQECLLGGCTSHKKSCHVQSCSGNCLKFQTLNLWLAHHRVVHQKNIYCDLEGCKYPKAFGSQSDLNRHKLTKYHKLPVFCDEPGCTSKTNLRRSDKRAEHNLNYHGSAAAL